VTHDSFAIAALLAAVAMVAAYNVPEWLCVWVWCVRVWSRLWQNIPPLPCESSATVLAGTCKASATSFTAAVIAMCPQENISWLYSM
jgi:hypothetical protein